MTLIIVLLVLGAVLMFLETFLPGLVTGMIGFLCWLAAVILGYSQFVFLPTDELSPRQARSLEPQRHAFAAN